MIFFSYVLFLLKVLLNGSLYPDDTSEEDKCHRRKNHKTVVHVSEVVYSLWDDLDSEECTASEKLTEEGNYNENQSISYTVSKTVNE